MNDIRTRFAEFLDFSEPAGRVVLHTVLKWLYGVFCVLLVAVFSLLPILMALSYQKESQAADASVDVVSKLPKERIERQLAEAREFNRQLSLSPQTELGERTDPFGVSGQQVQSDGDDSRYESLLDEGHGIMGSIEIPKISVKLPVFHGTSPEVLAQGAGHLYGTSLPVGGSSTNSVLAGHRGQPQALLFSRLDELHKGDFIYINTLGTVKGYRVIGVHVVQPDDTSFYTVVPGSDLVTLMTCTPIGINTQRLVVTATRDDRVAGGRRQSDAVLQGTIAAVLMFVLGVCIVKGSEIHARMQHPYARHGLL